jgi:hypothetical protein
MNNEQQDLRAGAFVRIGGVRYRLTPIDEEPAQTNDVVDSSPAGLQTTPPDKPDSDLAQQQLQVQQEMLALMTGEGVNVNVKNLDTQARFGS